MPTKTISFSETLSIITAITDSTVVPRLKVAHKDPYDLFFLKSNKVIALIIA